MNNDSPLVLQNAKGVDDLFVHRDYCNDLLKVRGEFPIIYLVFVENNISCCY